MTRTSVSETRNHWVAISPNGQIEALRFTPGRDPLPGSHLLAGLASRALPVLLLDHRFRLETMKYERRRLAPLWGNVAPFEEARELATRLDDLDAGIVLEKRLVAQLAAEITLRAAS